ncbi:unnamed protein product [Clonostachys byssicola]|uniref:RNase H type-1 domain-containing protein n=1 Tax=Clonostachys byssicola TaxID=160290 RepID=A0A9N9UT10_9HYPO|nr:unnamed protein product [Clonostachys byssicola]
MSQATNPFVAASLPPGRDHGNIREMYNGRIICIQHGFSTCDTCDVDYSFLDDIIPADKGEEDELFMIRGGFSSDLNDDPFTDSEFDWMSGAGSDSEEDDSFAEFGSDSEEDDSFAGFDIDSLQGRNDPFTEPEHDRMPEADPQDDPFAESELDSPQAGAGSDPQTQHLEPRAGTGRVFPLAFQSPVAHPFELVRPENHSALSGATRYIHRDNASTAFVIVSGSCLNNGTAHARGGWGIAFGPGENSAGGAVEACNPFTGGFIKPTSNRVKLRAFIAGVRACSWAEEGFNNVIIITDSKYLLDVGTVRARAWGPETGFVPNQDLWRLLLGEVERQDELGVSIHLWQCSGSDVYGLVNTIAGEASRVSLNPTQWAAGQAMMVANGQRKRRKKKKKKKKKKTERRWVQREAASLARYWD